MLMDPPSENTLNLENDILGWLLVKKNKKNKNKNKKTLTDCT